MKELKGQRVTSWEMKRPKYHPLQLHFIPRLLLLLLLVFSAAKVSSANTDALAEGDGDDGEGEKAGEEEQQGVRVFSMQRDATKMTTNEVFLRHNFSREASTTDALTICYWVRFVVFQESNVHFSYTAFEGVDVISVGHREDILFVWSFGSVLEVPLPSVVVPEEWYHACHLLSPHRYTSYWQGEEVHSGAPQGSWPFFLNGTVLLGQEQDQVGGGFDATQVLRGDVTQVYMWSRLLEASAVRGLASCGQPPARDVLFSTDASQLESVGAQESWLPFDSLCRQQPFYAILPEERNMGASRALCGMLGGSLALPTSSGENTLLTQQLRPFSAVCVPTVQWKLWLGVQATAAGYWTSLPTGELLRYHNFRPSSSTNTSLYGCAELRLDGFWEADYCTVKRCAACGFTRSSFLRLRGLCFDKELEARFRVEASPRGRPVLWSHQGLRLVWHDGPGMWQLEDPGKNITLLRGVWVGSNYPLGRRQWQLVTNLCGHPEGHTLDVSLSSCGAREFVCSTGECIAPHLRCNFHHDCPDRSDETGCTMVEESSDALLCQVPPPPPPGSPEGTALQLGPAINLTRVAAVDDLNMAITLEFQLTLTWIDSRLRFRHLQGPDGEATMLRKEDAARLWKPLLRVANLDGGKLEVLGRRFQATAVGPPTQPTFNDVNTDEVYEGSGVQLSLAQRFLARVACYLEMYWYPFDQQRCAVEVQLSPESGGGESVVFGAAAEVQYTGPDTLAMYTVRHVGRAMAGQDSLRVEFELHRRQGVIMLSTFLPSGLLLLVSWATLFVGLKEVNVRCIMSLTTLLVLYTLYANMSSSLPATASIKLIDVWFFFIIFLLFTNIMVHICVRPPKTASTTVKVFLPTEPQPQPAPPESEAPRSLRWYRLLVLPLLMVLFNFMFWFVVFMQ